MEFWSFTCRRAIPVSDFCSSLIAQIAHSCQFLNLKSFYNAHSLLSSPNTCCAQHSVHSADVKMQRLNCLLRCQSASYLHINGPLMFSAGGKHGKKFFFLLLLLFFSSTAPPKKWDICQSCSVDVGQIVLSQMDPIWANENDSIFL